MTVLDLLGVMALILGAFLIFNTFRTVVVERQHDLAMLRAIGATRRQIMQMIVIESLIQGMVGDADRADRGLPDGGRAEQCDAGCLRAAIRGRVRFQPGLDAAGVCCPVGLGCPSTLIAGYWPARQAGRTPPLEALRPSKRIGCSARGALGADVGGLLMLMGIALLACSAARMTSVGAVLFLIGMVVAGPGLVVPVGAVV